MREVERLKAAWSEHRSGVWFQIDVLSFDNVLSPVFRIRPEMPDFLPVVRCPNTMFAIVFRTKLAKRHPFAHNPGTVELCESLRQSRRI
jgi:hypothetical protein